MKETNEQPKTRILPLWKGVLIELRKTGLAYGKTYEANWFEDQLSCTRDTMEFGLSISELRRELEKDGFYLSGRGQGGNQFVILPPEGNADQMLRYQRAAVDALKRGVILGTNTRLDTLSDSQRRKHEAVLERMATRAALMGRTTPNAGLLSD